MSGLAVLDDRLPEALVVAGPRLADRALGRVLDLEQLTGASLEDDRHQLCCRLALIAHHTRKRE